MNPMISMVSPDAGSIDPALVEAVRSWAPRSGARPAVDLESRREGVRVKMTYLGVETGVMFARGRAVSHSPVQATLDRLFEVLSWRVTRPPSS